MRHGNTSADAIAAELAGIAEGDPLCGYSHDDHVHHVRVAGEPYAHRLLCVRRADHEGAAVAIDMHVGVMPNGMPVLFADVIL